MKIYNNPNKLLMMSHKSYHQIRFKINKIQKILKIIKI
jgi:hypothetical protein